MKTAHLPATPTRFLPVVGVLLATSLTVAACSPAKTSGAAAPTAGQAASMAGQASTSTTATPGGSPRPPASTPPERAGFASARAAWESAAAAPAATMNTYLRQAADDLRASGNSGYGTAINQLTYLAHLPATNDTPAQQAQTLSYVQALDDFFGTPGLMS